MMFFVMHVLGEGFPIALQQCCVPAPGGCFDAAFIRHCGSNFSFATCNTP